jgi:signal transduction histidine kinase
MRRRCSSAIAADLERPQSDRAQDEKARGERDAGVTRDTTAAQEHGTGRAGSGFTIGQMVAEFRALRASVTRLWLAEERRMAHTDLTDLIRFNEAIDQAIAESVSRFSQAVAQTQERFLAILSHDLRTPLGAIITSTRFMLDAGELEEPNRTLVTRASSSARRMNQMVLDLVEFTRTRLDDAIPSCVRRWTRGGSCTTWCWRSRPRTRQHRAGGDGRRSRPARGTRTDSPRR